MNSAFYQEFQAPAVPEPEAVTQPTMDSRPAGNQAHAALTSKDLEAKVAKAVASVIGASVQPDQPLVAAGLDSLGEATQTPCPTLLPLSLVLDAQMTCCAKGLCSSKPRGLAAIKL